MMIFLKTAWVYVKKYWQYALLIGLAIFAYFFFKKKTFDFAEQLQIIQDLHEEELRKITVAREEERLLRIENEEKLKDSLANITHQYEKAKQDLDEKKLKEIEEIVKKYSNNPEALAKKLSEAAGFTIIMPAN